MRTFYGMMKKKKNEIPEDKLLIFQNILDTYFVPGCGSNAGDNMFMEAIGEHFTEEERFRLWEQSGGCRGFGHEKARKAFAAEHAELPLPVKLDVYIMEFENGLKGKTRNIVLDEENNTITFTWACDECYNHSVKGKITAPFSLYYEGCAGGRMQNLQSALGIKLRIKSVEIPKQGVSKENPCVFVFEIVK
ncbi:MAG: hypothetical protein LBI19_02055 [Oscillospiraceae bacterium]|jgi:hypothetical protein|nr:hypothetical protein [Oscillospiraceae bacterium]